MKRLNVIVPLSRPNMLDNVLNNFDRQQYKNKSLVIVQNGPGLCACQRRGIQPNVLIDISEAHQSLAKNVALEYLREHGESYFATFDDDDYYGPNYLGQIADGFNRGFEIVGKSSIFLRFADERMFFLEQAGELREVRSINGPTISGVITKDTPLFRPLMWGEDNDWLEMQLQLGARIWSTSKFGFCWMRYGEEHRHTYQATDKSLENIVCALDPVFDCGQFRQRVVDGLDSPSRFDRMPQQELDLDEHPVTKFWERENRHGKHSSDQGSDGDDSAQRGEAGLDEFCRLHSLDLSNAL